MGKEATKYSYCVGAYNQGKGEVRIFYTEDGTIDPFKTYTSSYLQNVYMQQHPLGGDDTSTSHSRSGSRGGFSLFKSSRNDDEDDSEEYEDPEAEDGLLVTWIKESWQKDDTVLGEIRKSTESARASVNQTVDGIKHSVKAEVNKAKDSVKSGIKKEITDPLKAEINPIKEEAKGMLKDMKDKIGSPFKGIKDAFKNPFSKK